MPSVLSTEGTCIRTGMPYKWNLPKGAIVVKVRLLDHRLLLHQFIDFRLHERRDWIAYNRV